jgi:predicted amidohydrolase YtcJ
MKINDQRILRNGNIVNLDLLDRRAEALVIWKGERIGVGAYQEIRQHMEDFFSRAIG